MEHRNVFTKNGSSSYFEYMVTVNCKGENHRNTYNQDLHDHSLSLNIGGHENTFEEAYRTADALAEVIEEIMNE